MFRHRLVVIFFQLQFSYDFLKYLFYLQTFPHIAGIDSVPGKNSLALIACKMNPVNLRIVSVKIRIKLRLAGAVENHASRRTGRKIAADLITAVSLVHIEKLVVHSSSWALSYIVSGKEFFETAAVDDKRGA